MPQTDRVEIQIIGKDRLSADARKSSNALDKLDRSTQNVNKSFTTMTTASTGLGKNLASLALRYVGLTVAISATVKLLKDSFEAYAVQEKAEKDLAAAMKTTGNFTKEAHEELLRFAAARQKVTTIGDELTIQNAALLQTFKMNTEEIKRSIVAAQDLSTGLGIDLRSAALLVGKAFAGDTATLSRYGIKIAEGTAEAEKFNEVLKQVQERFGGRAQAEIETTSGKLEQLNNIWGDITETIGEKFANSLKQVDFEKLANNLKAIGGALGTIAAGLVTIVNIGAETIGLLDRILGFSRISESYNLVTTSLENLLGVTSEATTAQEKMNETFETAKNTLNNTTTAMVANGKAMDDLSNKSNQAAKSAEKVIDSEKQKADSLARFAEFALKAQRSLLDDEGKIAIDRKIIDLSITRAFEANEKERTRLFQEAIRKQESFILEWKNAVSSGFSPTPLIDFSAEMEKLADLVDEYNSSLGGVVIVYGELDEAQETFARDVLESIPKISEEMKRLDETQKNFATNVLEDIPQISSEMNLLEQEYADLARAASQPIEPEINPIPALNSINEMESTFEVVKDAMEQPIEPRVNEAGVMEQLRRIGERFYSDVALGGSAGPYGSTIFPGGFIPSFHSGTSYVPRTGLYNLQRGERVIPAGQNQTNNNQRNLTVNINTPMSQRDQRDTLFQLNRAWNRMSNSSAGLSR